MRWKKIIAILLMFLLTGCTDEPKEQEQTNVATQKVQTSIAKDDFTLSMRVPETFNPLYNRDSSVDRILKLMFLPLIGQSADGKPEKGVAESWALSPDGRTLSIQLRSGLKWQDGTPVTANDVVFSYQTILSAPQDAVYKKVLDYVAGCTRTSENSVDIHFRQVFSGNISALYFPVISQAYYRGKTAVDSEVSMQPLCNGSYRMESYSMASMLQLVANEHYIDGAVGIPKIQVKITAGEDTDVFSFQQDILDAMVADAVDAGKYLDTEMKTNSYPFYSGLYDFIGFNFRNELFQDKNMRQAVAYAVPREDIYETAYLQFADMTNTPIHPKSWLYETNVVSYQYDIDMATTLLKNAGFEEIDGTGVRKRKKENGTEERLQVRILVNQENMARKQIASKLESELEGIGFDVTIDAPEYAVYCEMMEKGDFDLVIGGWRMSEVLDLAPFFATKGMYNYIGYSNPEIDGLLQAANQAIGEGQTVLAYSNLQKRLSEELPYISLAYRQNVLMLSDDVSGDIQPNRINVYHGIAGWTLERGA